RRWTAYRPQRLLWISSQERFDDVLLVRHRVCGTRAAPSFRVSTPVFAFAVPTSLSFLGWAQRCQILHVSLPPRKRASGICVWTRSRSATRSGQQRYFLLEERQLVPAHGQSRPHSNGEIRLANPVLSIRALGKLASIHHSGEFEKTTVRGPTVVGTRTVRA